MASFFDKITGKARKKKIDSILDQSMGSPKRKENNPPPKKRDGGAGEDAITRMMNKLKREQDAKAKIKNRK